MMKKLSVSVVATLALGLLAAPAAKATCDPVYDPGGGCKFVFLASMPGGEARVTGLPVEATVPVRKPSYVKDLADDGLDVYVWVQYGKTGEYEYKEPIAVASGFGTRNDIEWTSPAGLYVEWFEARVCVGPGETNCSRWHG